MGKRVMLVVDVGFKDYDLIEEVCNEKVGVRDKVYVGMSDRAEILTKMYARERGLDVVWIKDVFRDLKEVDEVIAFWNGATMRTKYIIDEAKTIGIETEVVRYDMEPQR